VLSWLGPVFNDETRDSLKVGDIGRDQSPSMMQSGGGDEEIGVANCLTLPSQVCEEVGRLNDNRVDESENLAVLAEAIEKADLAQGSLGLQATQDFIASDDRESEPAADASRSWLSV
jgi:hypothetical protein